MGVQLNIKDEETVRAARKLASDLGQTVTAAIRGAIEEKAERLERTRRRASVEEALALVRGLRGRFKPEFDDMELSTRHGDLLYDENGLPN